MPDADKMFNKEKHMKKEEYMEAEIEIIELDNDVVVSSGPITIGGDED